jgi:hypothetical protein
MHVRSKLWPLVALSLARPAWADAPPPTERPTKRWRFALEVDPTPFFNQGYSVHAVWKPGGAPRWRFTFGSYGLRADAADNSDNAGWRYRETAFETSASYFVLDPRGRALFVGVYGFLQRFALSRQGLIGSTVLHDYRAGPGVGYQFLPWTNGPYVTPWISLGIPVGTGGHRSLGGYRYHVPAIAVIWGLHFGGEFETF